MRIVVCVEQVYDPKSVKISRSREELDLREATLITNPSDRYALEAALRLREAVSGEVVALTVGDPQSDDALREAIAMGADRTIMIRADGPLTGKTATALIGAAIQRLGGADLLLTAEPDALTGGSGLGPRLAAALGWPLVLDVVRLGETSAGLTALAKEHGGGVEIEVSVPAVITVTRGSERPRYPHPSRIANAWNDGLVETWSGDDLGVDPAALTSDVELGGLVLGPERVRGQVLTGGPSETAAALVSVLRTRRLI